MSTDTTVTNAGASDATIANAEQSNGEQTSGGCGSCTCGSGGGGCGGGRVPELDARTIDSAIRNAAIFGVLVGLAPSASAAIVTEEKPELVLMLIEEQLPGQYEVDITEAEPGHWRTKFVRTA